MSLNIISKICKVFLGLVVILSLNGCIDSSLNNVALVNTKIDPKNDLGVQDFGRNNIRYTDQNNNQIKGVASDAINSIEVIFYNEAMGLGESWWLQQDEIVNGDWEINLAARYHNYAIGKNTYVVRGYYGDKNYIEKEYEIVWRPQDGDPLQNELAFYDATDAIDFKTPEVLADSLLRNYHSFLYDDLPELDSYLQDTRGLYNVQGAVVGFDHNLTEDLLDFWVAFKNRDKVKTIYLLAEAESSLPLTKIVTSNLSYKTPYGYIHANIEKIHYLLDDNPELSINTDYFDNETTLYNLMPYFKSFFSQAQIVPLVISGQADEGMKRQLVKSLAEIIDSDDLVLSLATTDYNEPLFSAALHDKTVVNVLETMDDGALEATRLTHKSAIDVLWGVLRSLKAERIVYTDSVNTSEKNNLPFLEDSKSIYFSAYTAGKNHVKRAVSVLSYASSDITSFNKYVLPEATILSGIDRVILSGDVPDVQVELGYQKVLPVLKQAGFSVLNLASLDGVIEKEVSLDKIKSLVIEQGLNYFGDGLNQTNSCWQQDYSGTVMAWCAFNLDSPGFSLDLMYDQIKSQEKPADFTYVVIDDNNSLLENEITSLVYKIIDKGGDSVIVQNYELEPRMEIYKYRPIFYGQGDYNLNFKVDDIKTTIAIGTYFSSTTIDVYIYPYLISDNGAQIMDYNQRREFYTNYFPDGVNGNTNIGHILIHY